MSTCRGEMRSNKENERRPGRGRKGRGEVGGTAERLEGRPHAESGAPTRAVTRQGLSEQCLTQTALCV